MHKRTQRSFVTNVNFLQSFPNEDLVQRTSNNRGQCINDVNYFIKEYGRLHRNLT